MYIDDNKGNPLCSNGLVTVNVFPREKLKRLLYNSSVHKRGQA